MMMRGKHVFSQDNCVTWIGNCIFWHKVHFLLCCSSADHVLPILYLQLIDMDAIFFLVNLLSKFKMAGQLNYILF